jgi:hypothetical protein
MSVYIFKKINNKTYIYVLTDKYLGFFKSKSVRLWKKINEI